MVSWLDVKLIPQNLINKKKKTSKLHVKLNFMLFVSFLFTLGTQTQTWFLVEYRLLYQNSLPLTTHLYQQFAEPYKRISYLVGDLCRRITNLKTHWICTFSFLAH